MKKSTLSIVALALFTLFSLAVNDADAAPRFKKRVKHEDEGIFRFGAGYLSGDTTYRIDLADTTTGEAVTSELKFPLQTALLNMELGYISRDSIGRDVFDIQLRYGFNVGTASGKLEDSDWLNDTVDIALVGTANPGKDIYSESTIDLHAKTIDLRMSHTFWTAERFGIGPLAGCLYQSYRFSARDTHQYGYGAYAATFSGALSGEVLTYDVTYTVPYLGIHTDLPAGKSFRFLLDLGYSPWAEGKDEDDHLLRTKKAKAKTSGSAYLASLGAQIDMEDGNAVQLRGQYLKIDTSGKQTQTWYGNTAGEPPAGTVLSDINDKITSEQISAMLLFSRRF
ncbi:MAG: omptin family outer membrane protease [Nitrospirota bacterium]|nr:omptin family outer membrane protease [Nitrospirota bacterium]